MISVIECPTEDYLDSILSETAFYKHQNGDSDDLADVVVHFTEASIINNPKYQEWINRFPTQTKHVFINKENKSLGSVGVKRLQYKLNMLHSDIFPLLSDFGIPYHPRTRDDVPSEHTVVPISENVQKIVKPSFFQEDSQILSKDPIFYKCNENPFIKGETLCKIYIRPKKEFDYSYNLVLKEDKFLKEVLSIEGFQEELEKFKFEVKNFPVKKKYPKVLFLGTGSSQPNKVRNTSGILVFFDTDDFVLLDCGEGTFGQLVRFYGLQKAKEILRKLKVIYISHLHADHHMGLITILKERKLAFDEKVESSDGGANLENEEFQPVYLLAPIQINRWLTLFDENFEKISGLYQLIPNKYMVCHSFILNLKFLITTSLVKF